MPNFTLQMFFGPILMNKTLKVRCMPLPIESVVSAALSPWRQRLMGVAFAEVSPDFRFCINTHCHCGAVLLPPVEIRYCYAGGVHARRVGMGTV